MKAQKMGNFNCNKFLVSECQHDISKEEDYASPSIVPPQLSLYVFSFIDLLADAVLGKVVKV